MPDNLNHDPDMQEVTLFLTPEQLCKAASLGGYFLNPDDARIVAWRMNADPVGGLKILNIASGGITHAINQAFDTQFPPRYPDDVHQLIDTSGHDPDRFRNTSTSNATARLFTPWKDMGT